MNSKARTSELHNYTLLKKIIKLLESLQHDEKTIKLIWVGFKKGYLNCKIKKYKDFWGFLFWDGGIAGGSDVSIALSVQMG